MSITFEKSLQDLKASLSQIDEIEKPITTVYGITSDISDMLSFVDEIPEDLEGLNTVMETIIAACQLLIEIPGVDVIAEGVADVLVDVIETIATFQTEFTETVQEFVDPIKNVFSDLAKALKEAIHIVSAISITIPNYINTIQIISYILDLANTTLDILGDSGVDKSLKEFVDKLILIESDIAPTVNVIANFVQDTAGVVGSIHKAFPEKEAQDLKQTLDSAKSSFNSVDGILDPVNNAINDVENAIAPVRWVLDGVESLIEKILNPVVDEVIKVTGLQSLFDSLESELTNALHLQPLLDFAKGNFKDSDEYKSWSEKSTAKGNIDANQSLTEMGNLLLAYETGGKSDTKGLLLAFLKAATNTSSNTLPPWPSDNDTHKTSKLPSVAPVFNSVKTNSQLQPVATQYFRSKRLAGIEDSFVALGKMKVGEVPLTTAEPANPIPLSSVRIALSVPDDSGSSDSSNSGSDSSNSQENIATMLEFCEIVESKLDSATHIGDDLRNNLAQFDKAKQLPTDFFTQLDELNTLFDDGVKVLGFLSESIWDIQAIKDIQISFNDQSCAASKAQQSAADLLKRTSAVDSSILEVSKHSPSKNSFCSAVRYFVMVAKGAQALQAAIEHGKSMDKQLNGKYSSELTQYELQLNQKAGLAQSELISIDTELDKALVAAHSINQYLVDYAKQLKKLQSAASIIGNDKTPALEKGLQIANTVAAIASPLAGILNLSSATDNAGLPLLDTSMSQVNKGKSILSVQSAVFVDVVDTLLDKEFSASSVSNSLAEVDEFIKSQISQLQADCKQLSSYVDSINTLLKPTQSYQQKITIKIINNEKVSDSTKEVQIFNYFLDQELQTKVAQFAKRLGKEVLIQSKKTA